MSELKNLTYSYPQWRLVGHDFDSQEARICEIFGNMYAGISGATEFSKSMIVGDKKQKTDFHSLTAEYAGTGRDA